MERSSSIEFVLRDVGEKKYVRDHVMNEIY